MSSPVQAKEVRTAQAASAVMRNPFWLRTDHGPQPESDVESLVQNYL